MTDFPGGLASDDDPPTSHAADGGILSGGPQIDARAWGLSWIRTLVPVFWGWLLTFLATRFPELHDALGDPALLTAVSGAVAALWYGLWRWLEARLPAPVTRFLLGANTAPHYAVPAPVA